MSTSDIQFIDLSAQQQLIRPKIDAAIKKVLDHGQYIMGPEVAELEERLADFVGVNHCISVASGTDALMMALMVHDIGPGDAILTTPFTFVATSEVISLLGATPVFVDIDPATFNIDPLQLEKTITDFVADTSHGLKLKGVIPVDLFGLPADYSPINEIARRYELFVVEDAAQGLGGLYCGQQAGSLCDLGTTSFFPAKPLGCYGDGGALFTDDDAFAAKLRSIRVHGKGTDKYDNIHIGLNGRLDTLQAAILLAKMDNFPEEIKSRQKIAAKYSELLQLHEGIATPVVPADCQSVWAQYSILIDQRESLQLVLKGRGVPSAIYYPKPLHLQTAYAGLEYKAGDFPIAEEVAARILSLPMHPYLELDIVEKICGIITEVVKKDT